MWLNISTLNLASFVTLPDTDLGTDLDSDSKPYATLYYTEHVHIALILFQTWIPNCYCTHSLGQIPVLGLGFESVFGNVNKPLNYICLSRKSDILVVDCVLVDIISRPTVAGVPEGAHYFQNFHQCLKTLTQQVRPACKMEVRLRTAFCCSV